MPLTINPPRRPSIDTSFTSSRHTDTDTDDPNRSGSPVPPLASPLSPTLRASFPVATATTTSRAIGDSSGSSQAKQQHGRTLPKPDFIDRPPSKPFSGEDATDAIALRAAISSLQFQRQKAENDIKQLRSIRDAALDRPDEFQQHVIETARQQAKPPKSFDFSFKHDPEDEDMDSMEAHDNRNQNGNLKSSAFGDIPRPQDVVRCPPVNWDKYNVLGEPLDKMHNVQKRTGGVSTPKKGRTEHVTAAPYDPAFDLLESRQGGTPASALHRKDSAASATVPQGETRHTMKH